MTKVVDAQTDAQKKVIAIHDISCIGRCSLTVALPLISAAGVCCACVRRIKHNNVVLLCVGLSCCVC